ncbi:MAG: type II toxin-antitoxin system RelE/ParE family toxin [Gammaproteobacteria bacterium]|nr:type II toxin-antitoxin system RelE/ParE family toxin [Gammaproteobacteria bacterium]
MRVVWTDQSFERLAEIEVYISRDNPQAAEQHTERLIARTEVLAEHPKLGRSVPEVPGGDLRELVEGNYRIVYRIRDGIVEVLTVFEGHRLLSEKDI